MDKNEKLKKPNNNALSSHDSKKPILLEHAPEPRGKTGAQIDTDLDNY